MHGRLGSELLEGRHREAHRVWVVTRAEVQVHAAGQRLFPLFDADVLVFGHTHRPWVKEIGAVLMVNEGSVGKPKNGDPRAAWALFTVEDGMPVQVEIRRVAYDVASMAAAIRATDGLPDHFARDIETGGT